MGLYIFPAAGPIIVPPGNPYLIRDNVAATATPAGLTVTDYSRYGSVGDAEQNRQTAQAVLITCTNANTLRVTIDGTSPTATLGHVVAANGGSVIVLGEEAIAKLLIRRGGGTNSAYTVTFFGR